MSSPILDLRPSDPARYRSPASRGTEDASKTVDTSIGNLAFEKGEPTGETVRKLSNNLDLLHSTDVYLKHYAGVSLYRLGKAQHRLTGATDGKIQVFSGRPPQQLRLARTSRFHGWCCVDLDKEGATIIDLPPDLLGIVVDMWFRLVGDLGPASADGQRGGKYLILPPRQQSEIPSSCKILKPKSNRIWIFLRTLRLHRGGAEFNRVAKDLGIRSLADADGIREIELADSSKLRIEGVALNDGNFFEDLNRLVQSEPFGAMERGAHHLLASIGIVKGKPFRPNAQMKAIFRDAVTIGGATLRAITHRKTHPRVFIRSENTANASLVSRRC
jgi:hypothetical protein